ncbi:hypothetical protein ACHAQJ_007330 [Trichoderma viride]
MAEVEKESVATAEHHAQHEAVLSRLNTNDIAGVQFPHCHLRQSIGTVGLTVQGKDGAFSFIQDPALSRHLENENVFVPGAMLHDRNKEFLGSFFATESVTFSERVSVTAVLSGNELTFTQQDGKISTTFKKR